MSDFRVGYLYSLSPVHCGGEGDLGNIRDELETIDRTITDKLFGKKLDGEGQMGVHQVWFGDARLLWIPMATMARNNQDVFTWVSCHSLIRDHALIAGLPTVALPNCAVGTLGGTYHVADAQINVTPISTLSDDQKSSIELSGNWCDSLREAVKPAWEQNHLVLPDADFQILMEHSLWTQVRNKIQDSGDQAGSAEVFWTDVCIPRDTIFYYPWGYSIKENNPIGNDEHNQLMEIIQGLIQVGGQANVGRGWVQSWTPNQTSPSQAKQTANIAS